MQKDAKNIEDLDSETKQLIYDREKQITEELTNKFMEQLEYALQRKDEETSKTLALTGSKQIINATNGGQAVTYNGDQNVNVVLNINSYKNTDLSHLRDRDYLECIRKGNMGIPYLIEKIHFNPEKPENHNIFVNNIKSDYIKLIEDGKWKVALQYETINMMVQDKANLVEDKIEEWYDKNHKYSGEKYKEILDKYPRFLNRLNDSKYIGRKVEQESKLVLFNKKDMVLKYQEKIKEQEANKKQQQETNNQIILTENTNQINDTIKKEILKNICTPK